MLNISSPVGLTQQQSVNTPLPSASEQTQNALESPNPVDVLFPEQRIVGNPKLLASHFGIVPGVLIAEWMSEERRGLPIHAFTRRFHAPIHPGDHIEKGVDNGIVKVLGNRQVLADMNYRPNGVAFENFVLPDDFSAIVDPGEGRDWIPHGDSFRFCDKVGHQTDMLCGEWKVTNNYIGENGQIPFWQIEEACAQMMLGAYRKKAGEESGYGTYAEANTEGSEKFDDIMKSVKKGDSIRCVGKAEEIKDERNKVKQLRFLYSCYVGESLLFQGNIIGNCIPKKIWERQFSRK